MGVMEQHRSQVGRNVRQARRTAGLSLDRLGGLVGTSRQHLIRIEKGKHLPRPAMLEAIAAATGSSVSELEAADDEEEVSAMSPLARDLANALHLEARRVAEAQVAPLAARIAELEEALLP